MTEFVCGLIGLLLGAALFALGILSSRGAERTQKACIMRTAFRAALILYVLKTRLKNDCVH